MHQKVELLVLETDVVLQVGVASLEKVDKHMGVGCQVIRMLLHLANCLVDGFNEGHHVTAEVLQWYRNIVPLFRFEGSHVPK